MVTGDGRKEKQAGGARTLVITAEQGGGVLGRSWVGFFLCWIFFSHLSEHLLLTVAKRLRSKEVSTKTPSTPYFAALKDVGGSWQGERYAERVKKRLSPQQDFACGDLSWADGAATWEGSV